MDVPHTHANKYAYVVEKLHRYVKRHAHTHIYINIFIERERRRERERERYDYNMVIHTCIKLM